MDGFSALHFINTWSDIARGAEDTIVAALDLFDQLLESGKNARNVRFMRKRIYPCLGKSLRPSTSSNSAAIQGISAPHLPQPSSSCHAQTIQGPARFPQEQHRRRQMGGDQETRLYMTADARTRLKPPLPPGYFGNAILRTSVAAATGKILSSPLQSTAEKIHDAVVCVDDEYVRSVIDFLESWQESQNDLGAISWLHLPAYEADFGWGKPVFIQRAVVNQRGMLYLMRRPEGDGGITLTITMEPENLPRFLKMFYVELVWL
ncbi:unnamed protein product, partial [Musa hybrid cultivar]